MAQKICKGCKSIFEGGNECPNCGSKEFAENYKGKMVIINPESSEIAKNLKLSKKGTFAVKLG
ncbi:hypothetical protein J4461_00085 [Candidatus Pacearchaeota archaeon]|nr:hypothetical protein [Candidatus Pacearchaeota archaeon]